MTMATNAISSADPGAAYGMSIDGDDDATVSTPEPATAQTAHTDGCGPDYGVDYGDPNASYVQPGTDPNNELGDELEKECDTQVSRDRDACVSHAATYARVACERGQMPAGDDVKDPTESTIAKCERERRDGVNAHTEGSGSEWGGSTGLSFSLFGFGTEATHQSTQSQTQSDTTSPVKGYIKKCDQRAEDEAEKCAR
jgi:hypothetical protein